MADTYPQIQDSNQKNLNPARAGYRMSGEGKDAQRIQNNGITTSFEADKYNMGSATYPSDLYSNTKEYGGNYVIFYINVADDSKLIAGKEGVTITGEIPPRLRGTLVGQNLNKVEGAAAAGTAEAAAAAGGVGAAQLLTGGKDAAKSAADAGLIAGAGGLAAGGAVSAASAGMARQQKRLKQVIALHVPNQLNIQYSMDWQTDDTFMYQAAAMANREVAKAVATGGAKSNLLGTAGAIATNIALSKTPGVAGALSAASGLAPNPMKEQVFKNVNFREFTFDYQFSPRNSTEAANVREIIRLFKLHMHPEYKDKNNFVFIFPSEFDIYYYQGGTENLNMHRHTSCVLKNMSVNYTPNGVFSTFDDGMPTQINVTLSFLELAILTKDQILDNF